jgi:hypothetical protein
LNILKFNDFLLLEASLSEHADKRIAERITNSIVVTFPDKVMSKIYHTGKSEDEVLAETTKLVKQEFMYRLTNRIERRDFSANSWVVVLMDVFLKIGDDQFPVKLTVTSFDKQKDGSIKEKTYTGERICIYVRDNVMTTLKVMPAKYDSIDLEKDSENHLEREGIRAGKTKVIAESSDFIIELTKTGEVIPHSIQVYGGHGIIAEKEFALTAGRKIKVFLPFVDKENLTIAEVISVLNRDSARADKFIKVEIILADGRKVPKTLRAGDPIGVPVGPNGEFEAHKVADSLFVDYANRGGSFSLKYK